jgi:hypothetical protein
MSRRCLTSFKRAGWAAVGSVAGCVLAAALAEVTMSPAVALLAVASAVTGCVAACRL